MLTARRLTAVVVGALVLATLPQLSPASAEPPADPGDCDVLVVICPTEPPPQNPLPPPSDTGELDTSPPAPSVCRAMSAPVSPEDLEGLEPPKGVDGHWVYQVCGVESLVGRVPDLGTGKALEDWCAGPGNDGCSVVVYWKPKDRHGVSVGKQAGGLRPFDIQMFFANLASSPPDGNVVAQFPTWFWDERTSDLLGAGLVLPVADLFGVGAIAIHTGTDFTVDGRNICDSDGHVPLTTDAGPSPDCGFTFHDLFQGNGAQHRVEENKHWLIIIFTTFPPFVVVFPWVEHDDMNLNVREVQADSGR